ncbi:MAG: RNA polymerase sigma factor (sigma-70 family) [Planctomycetota bacterium]|jgi:RNA polymerase sigma-70 factor (ECF subfamily)|uniref:RNA polymerase sigma factor n=1 Tax=Patiriisocius sp. Uisw_047 TaxID=3230969 RepID=UPI0039E94C75
MKQPDALILSMQQGDEGSFSQLYDMYNEAIFGIIYSIVLNRAIAQEILQDVFIKIWNKRSSYDFNKGRFFTWILNIARNTSIDEIISKTNKNEKKNLSTRNFANILKTSDSLNRKLDALGIKNFVGKLTPACIRIIDLLFFKGSTMSDAAIELDIPLGTLKTKNRNCLKELRTLVLD